MKSDDLKEIEVKGAKEISPLKETNPNNLAKGDWTIIHKKDKSVKGKVTELFLENGLAHVTIKPKGNEPAFTTRANNENLDPLFFEKNGNKSYTEFSHQEIINLLDDNKLFNLEFKDLMDNKAYTNLRLGWRTGVIENMQLEKKAEGDKPKQIYPVDGRLQLQRRYNDGSVKVKLEIKNTKKTDLKDILDKPVYGEKLTAVEKKKLIETGEIGLKNFINKTTGEEFKAWVGLDRGLNKVVTRPEKSIRLNKIYGQELKDTQKESLKNGKAITLESDKGKFVVQVSAATTKGDGLRSFSYEKALEKNLISETKKNNKKQKVG